MFWNKKKKHKHTATTPRYNKVLATVTWKYSGIDTEFTTRIKFKLDKPMTAEQIDINVKKLKAKIASDIKKNKTQLCANMELYNHYYVYIRNFSPKGVEWFCVIDIEYNQRG